MKTCTYSPRDEKLLHGGTSCHRALKRVKVQEEPFSKQASPTYHMGTLRKTYGPTHVSHTCIVASALHIIDENSHIRSGAGLQLAGTKNRVTYRGLWARKSY